MIKTALVWFTTDLRLHDNETLARAIEKSETVIPVYCLNDAHFATGPFGFKRVGNFRWQFILESLIDLDKSLRALNSGLLVVKGKPEEVIFKLAREYGAQKVYAKKEVAYEEKLSQSLLEKNLWKIECELETYSTSTLYHATDLPFSIKDIPDVFTSYRKKVEKEVSVRPVFEKPSFIHSPRIPQSPLLSLEALGIEQLNPDKRAVMVFRGGETAGLERLHNYLFETRAVDHYKQSRNNLIGDKYSSKFSPWLALGCLSPRQIYHTLKAYEAMHGANESTYWLYFELLWRDYFRMMMKKHTHKYFLKGGIQHKDTTNEIFDAVKFAKWVNGNTDNDFIDANMIELKNTGFMSNRGRQNVASYLCHDLKLDWRYGAAYFEEQLIDYDVCSNWGNWAYVAGVGNDPRTARVFNTAKQADMYDRDGEYRNLWLNKR